MFEERRYILTSLGYVPSPINPIIAPRFTLHNRSPSPLNGKGMLSLGGAAYAIHRAASQLVASSSMAVKVCRSAFELMTEPFGLPKGDLGKLGSARLSAALAGLALATHNHYGENDVPNPLPAEVPVPLLLALDHVATLPPSSLTVDPYETSSTAAASLVSALDSFPSSSLLSPSRCTVPHLVASAAVKWCHTDPKMALSSREFTAALAGAARAIDPRTAKVRLRERNITPIQYELRLPHDSLRSSLTPRFLVAGVRQGHGYN